MKTAFISCRIRGDTDKNLADARTYYEFAVGQGVAPMMPHLLLAGGILNDDIPEERTKGIGISQAILLKADELWAVVDEDNGVSEGMLTEVRIAVENGIPIYPISRAWILKQMKGVPS